MKKAGFVALVLLRGYFNLSAVPQRNPKPWGEHVCTYYVAADQLEWNHAPEGVDHMTGKPFVGYAKVHTESGTHRFGTKFLMAVYREYTDESFRTLKVREPEEQYRGIVVPVLHAAVEDTPKLQFIEPRARKVDNRVKSKVQLFSEIRAILAQATQAASRIPNDSATTGDRTSYSDQLHGEDRRRSLLQQIAQAQARVEAQAGDSKMALQIAATMQNEIEKGIFLREIATTQANEGDIKSALLTAHMITAHLHRVMALARIAKEQARLGDAAGAEVSFKQALQEADVIVDNDPRQRQKGIALQEIVRARTASGDVVAALQVASRINSEYMKGSALAEIAAIQVATQLATGDIKAALRTITGNQGFLPQIAVGQAKAGDINGSLQTANAIKLDVPRNMALSGIATAQAEAGNFQGGLLTIKSINGVDSNSWKASALAQIAKAEAKANDRTAATKTFQEAIRAAKAIGTETLAYFTATKLAEIAETQAKTGDTLGASTTFEEAFKIADGMPNPPPQAPIAYSKAMAFSYIARAQAEAGDMQEALRTVNAIGVCLGEANREWPGGSAKITTLYGIANSQGKVGKSVQALVWINKLTSPLEQTWALLGVAEGLMAQSVVTMPSGRGVRAGSHL